jgi:hypothetical protein
MLTNGGGGLLESDPYEFVPFARLVQRLKSFTALLQLSDPRHAVECEGGTDGLV